MKTQVFFRKVHTGDEGALAVLCGQLGYSSSSTEIVERLSHFLNREEHFVRVATNNFDMPIGWIHACITYRVESDGFAEIGGMVVLEERRGKGIGTQLLAKVEEWARSRNV
ncbi:MAG: GNAT family N-acetyltransferase [Gammaproteobacteria bacterium]|nr:GNAT family N-acetyltransferase [Gammaproteobacteria bacterium]